MTTNSEIDVAQLELLKTQLLYFIKGHFNPCSDFITDLKECSNELQLKRLFFRYADEISEKLDGDTDLRDEIAGLETAIDNLKYNIEELQDKIDEYSLGNSINDEYKIQFFHEYHNNYTPWELEELLKNGKEYLKLKT